MVHKRVKELDLGGEPPHVKLSQDPPPPAITIYGVNQ